eukprot:evm.model.NODE_19127_length_26910_cov_44.841881.2
MGREGSGGSTVGDEEGEHVLPSNVTYKEEGYVGGVNPVYGRVFGLVVGEGRVLADGFCEGIERAWDHCSRVEERCRP